MLAEKLDQELYDTGATKIKMALAGKIEGMLIGDTVITDEKLSPFRENCVTCHELEHKKAGSVNLIYTPKDLRDKIEAAADRRAVMRLVPLCAVIKAYMRGAKSFAEFAEALEVDEEFFRRAVSLYGEIYGKSAVIGGMEIGFDPFFVMERDASATAG